MNSLTVSDLHFTEGLSDSYKWELFPWMKKEAVKYKVKDFKILGDLFEKKDKHSSEIVNRLVNEIADLATMLPVTILKGNHDYLKPDHPFLRFLNQLEDVTFVQDPTVLEGNLWLPHTRTPEQDWEDIDFTQYPFVFLHQSLIGSLTSNFYELNHGISPRRFRNCPDTRFYSGDIHVPQTIKIKGTPEGYTYIGTPYPVAFGDHYNGRGLIITDVAHGEINMPTIAKMAVKIKHPSEIEEYDLREGDQVKVEMELNSSEIADWPAYKKEVQVWCRDHHVSLKDLKVKIKTTMNRIEKAQGKTENTYKKEAPDVILKKFAKIEKLDKRVLKEGLELL